jgi:hypothetical protein
MLVATKASPARCRRRRLLLAGAVVAFAGGLLVDPVAASPVQDVRTGGIGLRLVDAPVASGDDPRAQIYIVDHLAPGAVIERRIELSNTTDVEQDVVLYAAAASIEGGAFVGAEGRTLNDIASWTSVTPAASTVASGSTTTALVTVEVPADATPGEQYGVVWAEVRSVPDPAGGVAQVSRVGLRLYVSVGPGGAPATDFTIETLTAERSPDGAPVVTATVRNTGGRAVDMTGTLELSRGPGGLSGGPFPVELGSTLGLGDTQGVRITLDEQLPDGPWHAVITLQSGLTERSATATLTFPRSGAAPAVAAAAVDGGSQRPMVYGAAGLAVLVAAFGWALHHRRKIHRRGFSMRGKHTRLSPGTRSPLKV